LNWTINLGANPETAFNSKTGTHTFTGDNNVVAGNGSNTIIGNNNGDVLIGGSGNDTIRGGTGDDVIAAGNGTNTMSGGGGNNTFVFTPGSFKDTITDFHSSNDELDFQSFAGLAAQNLISQILADVTSAHSAASTVIQLAPNEQITLVGVTYNQLTASHPFELNV
jgi:Ca2+-binding RTX toxin-like protein